MDLYRKNAGIVVFNNAGKVLLCARADKPGYQWQFPQGGINPGEDAVSAARRELREETGITSIELITALSEPLRYDFPPQILKKFQKNCSSYRGQDQYWALFFFSGDDSEIDLCANPQEIEFKAYEWADIKEAPERIVKFKKEVYYKVVQAFEPYIREKEGAEWMKKK